MACVLASIVAVASIAYSAAKAEDHRVLSFFGVLLARVIEEPPPSRFTRTDEIVQRVLDAGGALDTDFFFESEMELVRETVERGKLNIVSGSWADSDWLIIP